MFCSGGSIFLPPSVFSGVSSLLLPWPPVHLSRPRGPSPTPYTTEGRSLLSGPALPSVFYDVLYFMVMGRMSLARTTFSDSISEEVSSCQGPPAKVS